jgi:hypothetical protein
MEAGKAPFTEDRLGVIPALAIFILSRGVFAGVDIPVWGIETNVWVSPGFIIMGSHGRTGLK